MKKITLGDIASPSVITVTLTAPVSELLATMEKHRISCVVAVDASYRPLGIFTEQDAIRLMAELRPINTLCMSDVMSPQPYTAPMDMDFRDAYQFISARGYRHILVTKPSGELIGIASEADFLHHMGIGYLVELKTVATSMTREVQILDTSKTLDDAVKLMAQHKISCVVIAEANAPLGILTERDIVALAGSVTDSTKIAITQVMKSPVQTVAIDFPLQEAIRQMDRTKIRRLVVTDGGRIVGLVTRHDIVKSIQGRYVEYLQEALERQRRDLVLTKNQIKAARQQLLAHSLMEQTIDAVFVIQPDTSAIIDCNPAATTLLGYSHDELLRMSVTDIDANTAAPPAWQSELAITQRDGNRVIETLHRHRDGSLIPVEIRAQMVEREEQRYIVAIARDLRASKKAAAQLRVQDTALNSTANAIIITNIEGIIEWANPAFSEMTGYTLNETLGKRPKDLVHSGLQPREFYEVLWNTILSGQVWRGEVINKRKEGTHYTEEMTITPVYAEDKVITHFIAVKQDITQRKSAELKLAQSEATYRGILNNLTEAVYVVDETGQFLDINQGVLAMYGYTREEMLSQQNAWTITATEKNNLAELQNKLQKLFAGETQHMEFWGVRKNGEVFPKSVNGIRGEYFGRTVAIIVARDISAIKQAEQQQKKAEQTYRGLLNSIDDAICVRDEQGIFVDVNDAAVKLYGHSREEIIGQGIEFLIDFSINDRDAIAASLKLAATGQAQRVEFFGTRSDGENFIAEASIAKSEYFGKPAFIAVARDITTQKLAQADLLASERRYRRLIETAPFAVVIIDVESGTLVYGNHPAELLFEIEFSQAKGKKAEHFYINIEDRNRIAARQSAGEVVTEEIAMRTAQGRPIWVLITTANSLFDGKPAHIATLMDVTARRAADDELRTHRAMLHQIIDTAPLGIFWKDIHSNYLGCNSTFARLANLATPEEIIGKNDFDLPWGKAEAEAYRAADQEVIEKNIYKTHIIETQLQVDGSTIWVDTSKVPLKDPNGNVLGVLGTSLNITERKIAEEKLATREAYLTSIIENQPGLVWLKDTQGRYLITNTSFTQLCGQPSAQLVGKTDFDFWPYELAEKYREDDISVMQKGQPLVLQEQVIKNGIPQWFETFKSPVRNQHGEIIGSTGIAHDISARMAIEEQLREAAAVMENTHEGVVITDTTPKILAINAAYSTITGYSAEEVIGKNPNIVKSGRQSHAFNEAMWHSLLTLGYWQGEVWNRRKDGSVYPQLLTISTIYDENHAPIRYVGVFADISDLKENQAKLEFIAHHDPLTQLPNRALVESRLEQEIEQAHRHAQQLAVLFIDLDRFKAVNDSYGHLVGDELLCEVSSRLNTRLREGDTLGRLGGDEFILLITNLSDAQDAAVVARDFITALNDPFKMSNGNEVFIGGSIGISLFPQDGANKSDLMKNADAAMYLAKESGRNQFSFYTSTLNANAQSKLQMENDLRYAILQNHLLLHFQPQVDLHTGKICGAEALIRWRKNDGGLVPPSEFIPLAERSGLILSIGNWVIEQACLQLRLWLDEGLREARVAINVSARQFRSGNLARLIEQALKKYKVPAQHLEVELTESMLMHDPDAAIITLQQLKNLGIKLSLDDFGTGYSNFGYLSRFPIDMLKIDQSFVQNVVTNTDAAEITSAIIGLAHRMKLGVIAEGVETAAQQAFLQTNGCDELQGYYFSKPLPPQEFAALLRSGKTLAVENSTALAQRTLLIVEQDADTLREIKDSLHSDNYHILTTTRPAAALELMALHSVQVVLIDHHLPLVNAPEFLQQVQGLHPHCVRILLTDVHDELLNSNETINSGLADKLLTKPITDEHLRQHISNCFAYHEALYPHS